VFHVTPAVCTKLFLPLRLRWIAISDSHHIPSRLFKLALIINHLDEPLLLQAKMAQTTSSSAYGPMAKAYQLPVATSMTDTRQATEIELDTILPSSSGPQLSNETLGSVRESLEGRKTSAPPVAPRRLSAPTISDPLQRRLQQQAHDAPEPHAPSFGPLHQGKNPTATSSPYKSTIQEAWSNRNIVICCDGTGNTDKVKSTNVNILQSLALHTDLGDRANTQVMQQLVYYSPGFGEIPYFGRSRTSGKTNIARDETATRDKHLVEFQAEVGFEVGRGHSLASHGESRPLETSADRQEPRVSSMRGIQVHCRELPCGRPNFPLRFLKGRDNRADTSGNASNCEQCQI
jgi:hypothetical protein